MRKNIVVVGTDDVDRKAHAIELIRSDGDLSGLVSTLELHSIVVL